jgi:hypothetical protein
MKETSNLGIFLICFSLLLCLTPPANADVVPGDVIDKTNWQKVEGLLPESVLNWVKKGEFILNIGELQWDPKDYWTEACIHSMESNKGKFSLDEDGMVADAKTGKTPTEFVEGIPFPEVDLDDPQSAFKIMHNRTFYGYTLGNIDYPFAAIWVSRGGYDREVQAQFLQYPMVGFPGARKENNSKGIEQYSVVRVLSPYDIAGTNTMTWRYLDNRQDMTYAFVPAIRRVRRLSPANRSDAFIGTDMCLDDAYGYAGKISAVEWKPTKTKIALVPFLAEKPQALVQNERGEWLSTKGIKPVIYGYQKKDWQGAPWAPTNLVWVKREVLILEMKPKDPYYNYGTQYLWIDAAVPFITFYKVIQDRAADYWKTVLLTSNGFDGPNKEMRFVQGPMYIAIDDRYDHATVLRALTPETVGIWFAIQNPNIYSLGGFQKLCK